MTRAGHESNPWTPAELAVLLANPGMTAGELAALLPGRSARAVREKRKRAGRWQMAGRLCIACDARPVYAESATALSWGLCKECYLDERERRLDEERRSAALRQRERTWRNGAQRNEGKPLKGGEQGH